MCWDCQTCGSSVATIAVTTNRLCEFPVNSPTTKECTVAASESRNFLGRAFDCMVLCNGFYIIIMLPVWHTHTAFAVTEVTGAVGLCVHTQVIIPDFHLPQLYMLTVGTCISRILGVT